MFQRRSLISPILHLKDFWQSARAVSSQDANGEPTAKPGGSSNDAIATDEIVTETSDRPVPTLAVRDIHRHYIGPNGVVRALEPVSLEVRPGEFLVVVGPSGCGKSTLLNLLSGLLSPSGGEILFKNQPKRGVSREIGYVTQADNLFPWRTALGNVEFALEVQGFRAEERRSKALQLFERVGLAGFENTYPHQLSGGMRQRVNIVRTLVLDPEVILMDEPFGPLDALTRVQLQQELNDLWEGSGKSVVFVTHDLVEAITLADRVAVMTARPGRIKAIMEIPIKRPRDVFHIEAIPQFRDLHLQLTDLVLAEIEGRHG